ncbi:hypothetical protein VE04_00162 [Pseudogymnoascus sp. 24MN13]|nr:hypothetical protein VE04_00162 [Pseudogymnoascus sp. 24MN13]
MAIHLLFLMFPSMIGAVDIFRSNDPLPMQDAQLTLIWKTPGRILNPLAEPLTMQAGLGSSAINLNNIVIEGSFKPVSTNIAGTVN